MNSVKFIQIEPTTRCNFNCKFCCGRYMPQKDINFETFQQILNEFPDLQHIELQGEGEPLIIPQFFDMVKLAQSRGIKISMITNGSMFSDRRIDQILEGGIESIMVSIESPKAQDFKEIRGGKLDNVIHGIKALLKARNDCGKERPAIGFAVTVLKRTQDMLPLIIELYNQLGMDGKISVQCLNSMDAYSQIYDETISQELLSEEEQTLFVNRYLELLQSARHSRSEIKHFYDELFHQLSPFQESDSPGENTDSNGLALRSCPWLDKALYVNLEGIFTACGYIKDTEKFKFGKIGENTAVEIVNKRDEMREKICAGIVPESCHKCVIAESISANISDLLDKKPIINFSNRTTISNLIESQIIGIAPRGQGTLDLILQFCDGKTTCFEIINKICQLWKLDINVGRIKIIPVIDELILRKVITI